MRIKHLFILLVVAGITTITHARDFKTTADVRYSNGADRCVLDVYYPETVESTDSLPVIVWFHGGGLTGGGKYIPRELMTGEYIVVAPNYRYADGNGVKGCIEDAAAAVAWTIDSVANYGGDPSKLFVSGHSAGGYLTSMVGFDKRWLEAHGKSPDMIAGLFPFSGQAITHFAQRDSEGISPLTATVDELAPLFFVSREVPPYVIICGDREQELYGRYEENAYLWRMLKLTGHPYVYIYELDGYNHGDMPAPAFHIMRNHIKDLLKK